MTESTIPPYLANPFANGDEDRRQIWEILVEREISACLVADWNRIANDFADESFVGYAGTSNPDHWRIAFPNLASYRSEWLRKAASFAELSLPSDTKAAFLRRATVLRDIEINQDSAMAHKKLDGQITADGESILLNGQTVYWLRRTPSGWKITGFLMDLPHPISPLPNIPAAFISLPAGASQHVTAGPYSPALRITAPTVVAISGQGPIDPAGNIQGSSIQEQAQLTLENCRRQLESAGSSFSDVFKVVVYLSDMSEWDAFNEVYRRHFSVPYPVRTAIQVVLWGGMKVEIDMLAGSR